MIDRRSLIRAGAGLVMLAPLQALAAERGLDVAMINARVWTPGAGGSRLSAIGIVGERIAAVGADQVKALTTGKTPRIAPTSPLASGRWPRPAQASGSWAARGTSNALAARCRPMSGSTP
jgi:hypothetical protein